MSAERTDFVDVLPVTALKTGLAFVKGETVSARALALAAENILSYAANQFLPAEVPVMQGPAVMAGSSVDRAAAIKAFEDVLPDEQGTMKAGIGSGAWLTIIKALLPVILGLL